MKIKSTLLVVAFLVVYVGPVAIYAVQFGPLLSSEHSRWAEFGSAMAGTYAPIVAITTIIVLFEQVSLQRQINNHQYDQSYIQQARADIEFFGSRLLTILDSQPLPGHPLRDVLLNNYQPQSVKELDSPRLRELALNIHQALPASFDLWAAIYPIFMGLKAGKGVTYDMTFHTSAQKLVALLGFETCVALDNFHYSRSEGKRCPTYCFSPLLEK